LWSGTITFGLVSVPVDMYPANRTDRTPLRMLSPDGVPLSRRYYSPETGRDLADDQMTRGYEIKKGDYVVVTDEELEKLAPDKSRDIDMRRFVDARTIPPIYFERGYYLTPGGETEKAYHLLARTMEDSGKVGIGTFVMRGKEYPVAIMAENGILRAQTLRFGDEIRSPGEIGLPKKKKPSKAVVSKFEKLIARHSENQLSTKELKDEQTDRVLKLVKSKHSRKKDVVEIDEKPSDDGKVVDIMDVLKRSLAAKRKSA
jgi:DNA end-binding protein Ku